MTLSTRLPYHTLVTSLAGGCWLLGFVLSITQAPQHLANGAYATTMLLAFSRVARDVYRSLRNLSLDMNILMSAAVLGAILLGEWAEGAMVLWLFAVADWLEAKSMARTSRAIESLMELAPDRVRLVAADGSESMVPTEVVPMGSVLRVQPGERIGLDAQILSGQSQMHQAQITGEPLPVDRGPGDRIFAGSINGNGALLVETTRTASDSTVSRIIRLVQEARQHKAPLQKTVEQFARHYTPAVFSSALLLTLVPVLFFGQPFQPWFYRSLVVLLVGCPCAFIIATPVTLVSGLTLAARNGILIKGGAALEQAAKIKAFVFDKTGTLTVGRPCVRAVIPCRGYDESRIVQLAAAVSGQSGHLLGAAIESYRNENGIPERKARETTARPGLGASGLVGETLVLVGRAECFDSEAGIDELRAEAAQRKAQGQAIVYVGEPDRIYGLIALNDELRSEAVNTLRELRACGIKALIMISGDHPESANATAAKLPLDLVLADRMPDDKMADIERIRQTFGPVAMVGDGINDAPALVAADFGMAMGAGSDQALESAQGALMTEDLARLPVFLRIARKTARRVKVNIALALLLKFAFLALAAAGFASLWMAVLADTGASLIVIFSGLSLLQERIDS